jgi:hypothetical protein
MNAVYAIHTYSNSMVPIEPEPPNQRSISDEKNGLVPMIVIANS